MIKYHGGVLHTDAVEFHAYAGRSFCVSYAYPDKLELCHEIGQSVMLDNGAFSLWQQGKETNWVDYYRWCEPWLDYQTTWAVIPDVIDGDWRANDSLLEEWPFPRDKGAPVFHLDGPLARLNRLVDEWPLICLGSTSAYTIGSPPWRQRMEEVMDVACDQHGVPRSRLHMLRGLKFVGGPYPFYSADSASVARSWAGSPRSNTAPRDVGKFYASFDGRNPPARWVRPLQTEALFEMVPEAVGDPDDGGPLGEPHPLTYREARPIQRNAANSAQGEIEL